MQEACQIRKYFLKQRYKKYCSAATRPGVMFPDGIAVFCGPGHKMGVRRRPSVSGGDGLILCGTIAYGLFLSVRKTVSGVPHMTGRFTAGPPARRQATSARLDDFPGAQLLQSLAHVSRGLRVPRDDGISCRDNEQRQERRQWRTAHTEAGHRTTVIIEPLEACGRHARPQLPRASGCRPRAAW